MCGIIGYVGEEELVPILIEGLEKLQYRGYDSIGFCSRNEDRLNVFKKAGKIQDIQNNPELEKLKGHCGIGHTRWATHGIPNSTNSHPHLSCNNEIAIVHNGIIENFSSLKKMLIEEGHVFKSETDSEVLVHLIEKFHNGQNLEEATIKALDLIQGTYGIAVIDKKEDKIIAAKKGSPLIIGIGDNGMFVTSDVSAIIKHTRKVVYLEDFEIATITKDKYEIKKHNGENITKEVQEIKWNIKEIEKGGFKHFMLKEIFEQPKVIEDGIRGRLKDGEIKLSIDIPLGLNRIIIVACGTSWHSALIGKYIIEKMTRISVEVDYASEFRYRNPIITEKDLVIAVSQSGETADTLAAIKLAKSLGAKTLGIVNVVGSGISKEVDSGIFLHAGPEIGVASTKAFSSQVVALSLLGIYLKKIKENHTDMNLFQELCKMSSKIKEILKESDSIKEIAKEYKDSSNFLYLGKGINFPVALEGALKLKEISYIHAEGYPSAEMKHGPIALIDKNLPVVFIATKDSTYEKVLSNMEEVKARGGRIICITDCEDKKLEELSNHIIKVPKTIEEFSPILNVVPLQLLSYYIADMKGLNVDQPRNLAKSVTVE